MTLHSSRQRMSTSCAQATSIKKKNQVYVTNLTSLSMYSLSHHSIYLFIFDRFFVFDVFDELNFRVPFYSLSNYLYQCGSPTYRSFFLPLPSKKRFRDKSPATRWQSWSFGDNTCLTDIKKLAFSLPLSKLLSSQDAAFP